VSAHFLTHSPAYNCSSCRRAASLVSRTRYALCSLLSWFCPILRCALTTGEYVFDFAVVVFGVRIYFYFSARLSCGRLPRGLRACAYVINLLYYSGRALLRGDARRLRDVATRTHARRNTSSQLLRLLHHFVYVSRLYACIRLSWLTD